MRRASNYSVIFSPDAPLQEQDSYTCYHCNKVILVQPGQRGEDVGGLCKQCMNLVCPECTHHGTCTPFEERLRQEEARHKFLSNVL